MVADIGARIARMRKARGWTQEDLAGRMGTSREYVAQVETGMRGAGVLTLMRLARAFNVTIDDLLTEEAATSAA